MGELIRILGVARSQWLRMAGGILLAIAVMMANALLMAISGWFIASMAVAGVTGVAFNYLIPAAAIRAFAILMANASSPTKRASVFWRCCGSGSSGAWSL